MAYFKIGNTDLSMYVAKLKITKKHNYTAQTNAAGDSVVDYINNKRIITVEIIPLEEDDFQTVLGAISFSSTIWYRDPATEQLVSATCIIDSNDIDYYTIQTKKVMYNKMTLKFTEL